MTPVLKNEKTEETPWHSSPYQSLPTIYEQNASLEIAFCEIPLTKKLIAGDSITPFITRGYEGFDINYLEDWYLAEILVKNNICKLPKMD